MAQWKVRFIDADAARRKYIAAIRSKADYEVEVAASGIEGLRFPADTTSIIFKHLRLK